MVSMNLLDWFDTLSDFDAIAASAIKPKPVRLVPDVKRILFNPPATIVFWMDGTKTVVKCMEGETFSPYYGFIAALAKKIYGSNNAIHKMLENWIEEAPEQEDPKKRKENYINRLSEMLTGVI